MKLYARIVTSRGKMAAKGDNEQLHVEFMRGNEYIGHVYLTDETMIIERGRNREVIHLGNKQKGEEVSCENHAYYREDCGECRRLSA